MINYLTSNHSSFIQHITRFHSNTTPGVVLVVDGVLKRGHHPIPQAKQSIELLRKHKIPFLLVMNQGGALELSNVQTLTKILQLKKEDSFEPSEIITYHTPMQSILEIMSKASQTKIPLIVGCGDLHNIVKSYKVDKYITDTEYGTIFSHILGFNTIQALLPYKEKTKKIVEDRLKMKIDYKRLIGINGIFQITDCLNWEIPIQLCCDLLISKDGIPGTERSKDDPCVVEYHLANPDVDFADNFPIPRLGGGAFFFSLQELFKLKYKFCFPHIPYGKLYQRVDDFAKRRIRENNPYKQIGNYYMICDNPETDIKGANSFGMRSILVRTKMFNSKENDTINPGKTLVDNVLEAINFIIDTEHI